MKRPNKDEYEKTMNSYKAEMDDLKAKLEKIVIPKDELNTEKQEKRQVFQTLLKQKQDVQQRKNTCLNQIKQLQQLVKQKGDTVQKELEKLGYKSPDEVQSKITKLETELTKGVDSLMAEKQIVAEIANLKKVKGRLLDLKKPQKETEKGRLDQLRIDLKQLDEELKTLNAQVTEAKTVLTAVEQKHKEASGSIKNLFDKKKDLQNQLSTLKQKKSDLYESFRKEQEEYKAYMDKVRAEQREEERKRRMAEREQKLLAQLERELEEAEMGAFKSEITTCDALISQFTLLLPSTKEAEQVFKPTVVNDANQPARSTLLVRKEDRDDDYFFVASGKKSKKKVVEKERPFKLALDLIDQLAVLGVDIPKKTSDLPGAIEQLQEKKKYFVANSAEQTEINKKNAMDKIRKLKEELAQEVSEE